jgi:TrmH family RNA methyltransferase
MQRITSRQNAVVSRYRSAAAGDAPGQLLLDGPHLVAEAIASGIRLTHAIVSADALDAAAIQDLVERLIRHHIDVASGSASVMAAVSPVRSASPIVALANAPDAGSRRLFSGKNPLVVVACDVQDPGNIGAIVRVAEAGGAAGLIAAGESADPFSWKALRGSMGSALRLPIAVYPIVDAALRELQDHRCRLVATQPRLGRAPQDVDLTGPVAILIGAEGAGLRQTMVEQAADLVTIPMQSPVESLNAAVTAALLVYEARRQRLASRHS